MRILIVEDEKKVANFIKKGLQQEGYAADIAQDGEEALESAMKASMSALLSGLIGSLYPALRAAAQDPVEACAYE